LPTPSPRARRPKAPKCGCAAPANSSARRSCARCPNGPSAQAPTEADADWADAIVFGTPTRFGSIAAELKAYIDSLGGLWFQGKLNGKVGSVFGSTSSKHGGNESTLLSLYGPMAHLGLIIVPLGYADAAMFAAGTPYGATHVSHQDSVMPSAEDLAVATFQGRRVALTARALRVPQAVAETA
jgi:NAD(P)H dehydrogenase (quinone)